MGFLAAKGPVVVVGDICVDGDADVGEVLHQAVGLGFADHEAALLDHRVAGRSRTAGSSTSGRIRTTGSRIAGSSRTAGRSRRKRLNAPAD